MMRLTGRTINSLQRVDRFMLRSVTGYGNAATVNWTEGAYDLQLLLGNVACNVAPADDDTNLRFTTNVDAVTWGLRNGAANVTWMTSSDAVTVSTNAAVLGLALGADGYRVVELPEAGGPVRIVSSNVDLVAPEVRDVRHRAFRHDAYADALCINPLLDYANGVDISAGGMRITGNGVWCSDLTVGNSLWVSNITSVNDSDLNVKVARMLNVTAAHSTFDGLVTIPPSPPPKVIEVGSTTFFHNVNIIDTMPGMFSFLVTDDNTYRLARALLYRGPMGFEVSGVANFEKTLIFTNASFAVLSMREFVTLELRRIEVLTTSAERWMDFTTATFIFSNVNDADVDGAGLQIATAEPHLPGDADPDDYERSIKWRAQRSWYGPGMVPTADEPELRPRWELSGGNLMIKPGGQHTGYVLGVTDAGAMEVVKATRDPTTNVETAADILSLSETDVALRASKRMVVDVPHTTFNGIVTMPPSPPAKVLEVGSATFFPDVQLHETRPGVFTYLVDGDLALRLTQSLLNVRAFKVSGVGTKDKTIIYANRAFAVVDMTEYANAERRYVEVFIDSTERWMDFTTATFMFTNMGDADVDGAGMQIATVAPRLPVTANAADYERSIKWRAEDSWFTAAGVPTPNTPARRPRWEVSGGNLLIRAGGTVSYLFGVSDDGKLQLFKVTKDPSTHAESSIKVFEFGDTPVA
jgi:predicted protein tyrosine phosphatase